MTPIENWVAVNGYEGFYQVSDHGRIRGIDRMVPCRWGGMMPLRGRVISTVLSRYGYPTVHLSKHGVRKRFLVHRIVLESFIGNAPEKFVVCHNDSNKTNNTLCNLRWDTQVGNMADTVANGTSNRGERNHFAKLTCAEVLQIKKLLSHGVDMHSIADRFRVSWAAISDINKGRRWSHVDVQLPLIAPQAAEQKKAA